MTAALYVCINSLFLFKNHIIIIITTTTTTTIIWSRSVSPNTNIWQIKEIDRRTRPRTYDDNEEADAR